MMHEEELEHVHEALNSMQRELMILRDENASRANHLIQTLHRLGKLEGILLMVTLAPDELLTGAQADKITEVLHENDLQPFIMTEPPPDDRESH